MHHIILKLFLRGKTSLPPIYWFFCVIENVYSLVLLVILWTYIYLSISIVFCVNNICISRIVRSYAGYIDRNISTKLSVYEFNSKMYYLYMVHTISSLIKQRKGPDLNIVFSWPTLFITIIPIHKNLRFFFFFYVFFFYITHSLPYIILFLIQCRKKRHVRYSI